MKVYLDHGAKEVAAHTVYISPAGHLKELGEAEYPASWVDLKNNEEKPRTFEIHFRHGMAEVSDEIGNYMVRTGLALKSRPVKLVSY